jgi:hypothetical protein
MWLGDYIITEDSHMWLCSWLGITKATMVTNEAWGFYTQ